MELMLALKRAGVFWFCFSLLVEALNLIGFFAATLLGRREVEFQQGCLEVACMLECILQQIIGFLAVFAASMPRSREVEFQQS